MWHVTLCDVKNKNQPLLWNLKSPTNLTYSYVGGSFGSMFPLAKWQQNSTCVSSERKKVSTGRGNTLLATNVTAIQFVRQLHKVEVNVLLWLWPQSDFDDYPKIEYNDLTDHTTVCVCALWFTSKCDQWNRGGSGINKSTVTFFYQYFSVLVCVCLRDWGQGKSCM